MAAHSLGKLCVTLHGSLCDKVCLSCIYTCKKDYTSGQDILCVHMCVPHRRNSSSIIKLSWGESLPITHRLSSAASLLL